MNNELGYGQSTPVPAGDGYHVFARSGDGKAAARTWMR